MKHPLVLLLCLAALAPLRAEFADGVPTHPLFIAGGGHVAELTPQGETLRQWRVGNVNDAWRLPNGNVLVADGAAWEATPDGKRVWEYKAKETKGGGVFSCQRLPNGNTLIAENSTGRIFERTPDGRDLNVIQVPLNEKDRSSTARTSRRSGASRSPASPSPPSRTPRATSTSPSSTASSSGRRTTSSSGSSSARIPACPSRT